MLSSKDMTKPDHADRILVAADHQLVSKSFYINRVWGPAREAHKDLRGRTAWFNALTLPYDFDGRLYYPDRRPYHPPDIEEVFRDPQNRWMSRFLKADETGQAPAHYCRDLEKLRLIELYCRLRHLRQSSRGAA